MSKFPYWGYLLSGLGAGIVAGLFGAGGGLVLVPLLTLLTDTEEGAVFPSSISVILSICLVTLTATAVTGSVSWREALPYLPGGALGGFLAGKFGKKDPGEVASPGTWHFDFMGRDPVFMELMVGAVLGFLSGLGIGGGSLLILYLTLVMGMGQEMARGINLLFYLPCAGIAALIRWKEGSVDLHKLLPAVIAGCIGAAVCSLIAARADTQVLQTWFGWLLLVTGLRELFYKNKSS